FKKDVIAMREEEIPGGEPLLQRVMHQGKPTGGFPPLNKIREVFLEEFSRLGARFKRIQGRGWAYPVVISPGLKALRTRLLRQIDDVERSK
ncbi:MAG: nicotinate phosphoribosyltransferase, partial [Candidatus Aminicenantales bacterium]